jgi:hypothetical protein
MDSALADIPLGPAAPQGTPLPSSSGAPGGSLSTDSLADVPLADTRLHDAYDAASRIDPDHARQVNALSRKTGLEPGYVSANLDTVKKAADAPTPQDLSTIQAAYPKTAYWAAAPANMAAAHDDLGNLTLHERLVNGFQDAFESVKNDFYTGILQAKKAALHAGTILGQDNAAQIAAVEQQMELYKNGPRLGEDYKEPGALAKAAHGAVEMAPQVLEAQAAGAAGSLTGAGVAALTFPPAVPAAAEVGYFGGEGMFWGAQIAGQAKEQLSKIRDANGQPIPEGIQRVASLAIGVAGAAPSVLAANNVLKSTAVGRALMAQITQTVGEGVLKTAGWRDALMGFAKNSLEQAGVMGANMSALAGVQGLGVKMAKNASGQPFAPEDPMALTKEMGEQFAAGAGVGLMMGLPGLSWGLGTDALRLSRQAEAAEASKTFVQSLHDASVSSKLRAGDPQGYADHLDTLAAGTPAANVLIPGEAFERYFQGANIDPARAAEELGVRDSYEEAQKTGGLVSVPLGKFQSKEMDAHRPGLTDDITFDPEILTTNQRKERATAVREQMDQEMILAQNAVEKDATAAAGFDMVHNDITARMGEVERPESFKTQKEWTDYIDNGARLWASRMVAKAERRGITVEQAYNDAMVSITGRDASELDEHEASMRDQEHVAATAAGGGVTPLLDHLRANPIDPEKLAKDFSKAELQDMEHLGILRKGGVSPERAAESAHEAGLLKEYDRQEMYEKARDEVRASDDFKAKFGDRQYRAVRRRAGELSQGPAPEEPSNKSPEPSFASSRWIRPARDFDSLVSEALRGEDPRTHGLNPSARFPDGQDLVSSPYFDRITSTPDGVKLKVGEEAWTASAAETHPDLERHIAEEVARRNLKPADIEAQRPGLISHLAEAARERISTMQDTLKSFDMTDATPEGAGKLQQMLIDDVERYHLASGDNKIPQGAKDLIDALGERASEGKPGTEPTLFQKGVNKVKELFGAEQPQILEQAAGKGNRGYFDPVRRVIGLMKTADASTFMHESAHAWLEDEFSYIKSGRASPEYMKDWKTLGDWLGVEDGAKKLTREQHEQFAKGFEVYLSEGKAPSRGLRRVFAGLQRWLTGIYSNVSQSLGVKLNPEVREVMDRMVATDAEIRERERASPLMSDDELSRLDPEEAGWIRAAQQDAHDDAVSDLLREQLGEKTAARVKFLTDERERVTTQIEKDAREAPTYKAAADMRKWFGEARDVKDVAADYLGEKLDDAARVRFDSIAEERGFQSGHDMATQIGAEPAFADKVKAQVDAYMSQYADLKDTVRIKAAAEKAVHNDKALELMALERAAMGRGKGAPPLSEEAKAQRRAQAKFAAQAAREQAREILSGKSVDQATAYRPYITAERNAAVKAAEAMMRGDMEGAQKYKNQQMLNHALALESMRNKAESQRALKFLDKYAERKQDFKNMPYGFIRQIDALLESGGLKEKTPEDLATNAKIADSLVKKGVAPEEIANATGLKAGAKGWEPETLPDFVQRANDDYHYLPMPASLLGGGLKGFPHLSMADLRDLKLAVQMINEVGRGYDKFLSFETKVGIKAAAEELSARIQEVVGRPYADKLAPGFANDAAWKDKLEALKSLPDAMIPSMVNLRTLAYYLDGGAEGPAHDYMLLPLERAGNWKFDRRAKMMEDVRGLFEEHYKPEELAAYKTERSYTFAGRNWTKEQLLSMALNWGNEGNRDRIMRGFGLEEPQVRHMLDTLGEKDWKFVQGVWDHLESYWPEIKAQEMAVNGFEPGKVPASPVETRYGTFSGGYYPLAYDFEKSGDAFRTEEQKNALFKQYSAVAAHTEHGFTQGRVDTLKRPVRLSLDVMFNHLENVVHDLAYRKAVIDVQRFLRQVDAKDSIVGALDVRGYDTVNKVLKAVASDQGEFLTGADKAFRWFRFGGTFATLGFRATTFPLRLAGDFSNAAWEIGPTRLAGAMKDYYLDPEQTKGWVDGKSPLMRSRAETRERDLMDLSKSLSGENGGDWRRHAFIVDTLADQVVAYPMWSEVYKSALADHPEEKAVQLADDAVARSFGSGTILDQVGAQRGSELKKLTSMYYSWTSMMFNRAWLDGKIAGLEYNEGNRGKAAGIVAKTVFYSWLFPALYENLVREAFRNSQTDDDKARTKRMVARTLELPFGYMPVVRDIAAAGINKAMGERGADYRMSPMEDALNTVLNTASKTAAVLGDENKHFDEKWSEEAARSAAIVLKYPQQANTWVFNFLDWMEDKGEATWRDLLTRRTKK